LIGRAREPETEEDDDVNEFLEDDEPLMGRLPLTATPPCF